MMQRLLTVLLLLVFSGLPVAAQVYQVAAYLGEALAQNSDEGELMECCLVAGQCQMQMMQPAESAAAPATPACPLPCSCAASEPALPPGLLASLPQTPSGEEAPVLQAHVVKRATVSLSVALLPNPPLLPATKAYLRQTCLRI